VVTGPELQVPLKMIICMPPLVYPAVELLTHTEKETVFAEATNLMKELFCRPKQGPSNPDPVQFCTERKLVFPQTPLKSQMGVAVEQDDPEGILLVQPG
jgi:hypothetical protein